MSVIGHSSPTGVGSGAAGSREEELLIIIPHFLKISLFPEC